MYRILRWLRIIVAIYTLVIAALLGVQCMRLYIAGNSPANIGENGVHITPVYTVDKVCAALRPVAPAALAEVSFHDNPEDARFIVDNMEEIGQAIARGILDYFGMPYN